MSFAQFIRRSRINNLMHLFGRTETVDRELTPEELEKLNKAMAGIDRAMETLSETIRELHHP